MNIKSTLAVFLIYFSINGIAQTQLIDSLENKLSTEVQSQKRVDLLHKYVWEIAYYNPEKAIEPAREALKISEDLNDSTLIARSYNRIGLVFDYAGNFNLAEVNYKKAYYIKLKCDRKSDTDGILNNLGSVYYYMGRYKESMEYYLKSLKLRQEKLDSNNIKTYKLLAQSYNNIALLLKRQKNFSGAIEYYYKALSIKTDLKDFSGIITSKSNLGVLHMEQDSLLLAEDEFVKSLNLADSIGDFVSKAMLLNNLGLLNVRKKDINKAESYYQQSVSIYNHTNDQFGKSAVLINLASLFFENKEIKKASASAKEVLQIGEEIKSADVQLSGLRLLSKIYEKEKPALSLTYLSDYINLKDSIDNLEINKQISQQAIMFETEKKDIEIDLLKKDQVIDQAQIEQQELMIVRNRNYVIFLIIGIVLVLILAVAITLFFRTRKIAVEERASKQYEKHQREIDHLRNIIEKQIETPAHKESFGLNQVELNRYLLNPLSEREIEVLHLIADGLTNKEISSRLFISVNTVKSHVLKIYQKLDVQNRTAATVKANSLQIIK